MPTCGGPRELSVHYAHSGVCGCRCDPCAAQPQVDLLRCDLAAAAGQARLRADTVIMNPPFGTRRRGADLDFLRVAFQARGVYRQVGIGIE